VFQKIRYRLLLSYLLVFASLLGIFALAVRVAFTRSLTAQITDKLTAIGKVAAANVEFEKGRLAVESDFHPQELIAYHQALQWFDTQGNLITQQGKTVLTLPLLPSSIVQIQTDKIPIQAVTVPIIKNDHGEVVGYVRVSQSLEEFHETLEKLDWGLGGGIMITLVLSSISGIFLTRQAMQPIEDSFQRLKQFTADASHELRSPLMAIKINAELPLEYPEEISPKDADKFQAIVSATNQMTRLTEDLLLLARTDKIPTQHQDIINLTLILENLIQLYKPQFAAKQINFTSQLVGNLQIIGDSLQLTRLFTNLVENAIYYTPLGGTVEIKTSRVNSQIYVRIEDTGVGIAPEDIDKIFERFWRADQSRSCWSGGSGLGLSIAQAIAQNHNGLINVTSQLEVGTCFIVRLPTS
jgi:signal transduction histidine kinase